MTGSGTRKTSADQKQERNWCGDYLAGGHRRHILGSEQGYVPDGYVLGVDCKLEVLRPLLPLPLPSSRPIIAPAPTSPLPTSPRLCFQQKDLPKTESQLCHSLPKPFCGSPAPSGSNLNSAGLTASHDLGRGTRS